jgi:hypothetical protein
MAFIFVSKERNVLRAHIEQLEEELEKSRDTKTPDDHVNINADEQNKMEDTAKEADMLRYKTSITSTI